MKLYKNGLEVENFDNVMCLLDGFVWVPGYEGLYMINREGVLISVKRKYTKKTMVKKPHLRANSKNYKYKQTEYYAHSLSKNRVYSYKSLHRLLAECFIENPEGKEEVNHIDGNTLNNSLDNLEWVTRSENQKHAFAMGLNRTTENVMRASSRNGKKRRGLTIEQVSKILSMYGSGMRGKEIAEEMGIKRYTVYRVINRETYATIFEEEEIK